ncbi:MAG: NAD(P)H-hydrate dehydratase [Betaproteobacteria bacterium]
MTAYLATFAYTEKMITTPVYTTDQIREIERIAFSSVPSYVLMERAGRTISNLTISEIPQGKNRVLILAGPGNNGGDAYIAASNLKSIGFEVTVVSVGKSQKKGSDAEKAREAWIESGGTISDSNIDFDAHDLIIDGLLGIGLSRDIEHDIYQLITKANRSELPIISIDIPSGLDSENGDVRGVCIHATHTVTFLGYKIGLHTGYGPDYCGEIHLDLLGLSRRTEPDGIGYLIGEDILRHALPLRRPTSNKGNHGHVAVIGGAFGMTGAATLAARAALNLGSGRVTVGFLSEPPVADWIQPELMLKTATECKDISSLNCICIGPGLGMSQEALEILNEVLEKDIPVVLDADAINLVAKHEKTRSLLTNRTSPTLLTPHPGEAARLIGCEIDEVQSNRILHACNLSEEFDADVLIKGAGSVCALSDGSWFINTSGNPGLASAGMGDALTGIIGALIAQGAHSHVALLAGVHLHGLAADDLVKNGIGPIGITASETIKQARLLLNRQH